MNKFSLPPALPPKPVTGVLFYVGQTDSGLTTLVLPKSDATEPTLLTTEQTKHLIRVLQSTLPKES